MSKKSYLILALFIICINGCCIKRSMNDHYSQPKNKSQNDFVLYAKNVHSIFFRFNGNEIKDESISRMKELITQLKKVRNVKLVMYGYTDKIGTDHYNHSLAMRRVKAVKKMLIHSGVITANNISIEAYAVGESDPLISKHTISNNPHSRRVDVYITSTR